MIEKKEPDFSVDGSHNGPGKTVQRLFEDFSREGSSATVDEGGN